MREALLKKRREGIFGMAVLAAGIAISILCVMPLVFAESAPQSLFPTAQQERFFFDLFSIACGCWLLSWVSALNDWGGMSRVGQWLGIILLCANEAILISLTRAFFPHVGALGMLAPGLVQTYVMGCLFGFFTLPSLTQAGNRTLTGLGTLVLILPWLLAKDAVVAGTAYLFGMFS